MDAFVRKLTSEQYELQQIQFANDAMDVVKEYVTSSKNQEKTRT